MGAHAQVGARPRRAMDVSAAGLGPLFWPLAFLAGTLSFTSPCVLPLLPGYLSFITGVHYGEVGKRGARLQALLPCLCFVLGFSVVFTLLGATASAVGDVLRDHRQALEEIAGVFIVVMALVLAGVVRVPALMGDYGVHLERRPAGTLGAVALGMAFAIGWTPCVGPILAAVLAVAGSEGTALRGALLLLTYSAGLGVPFLIAGLFMSHFSTALGAVGRRLQVVTYAGSAMLGLMGVLLITDRWMQFLAPLLRLYANLNWPPF